MDLPEDKGTYVLIASVAQMKRLEIGSLGRFDIIPGFYAYVGSAFGLEVSARVLATTWGQPLRRTGTLITCWESRSQSRSGSARRVKNLSTAGQAYWKRPPIFAFRLSGSARRIITAADPATFSTPGADPAFDGFSRLLERGSKTFVQCAM
jgi:hypothetical protein